MENVVLIIHLILAIALVVVVLLQRSDGGALGGLGGGAFGGVMSGRQSAHLLTRTTAILATCFIGTSLILAIMASGSADIDQDAPLGDLSGPQIEDTPPEPEETGSDPQNFFED